MMSGILWIPDLQMCMLTFLIKAKFVNTTKCYKVKWTKSLHMKKLEIVMNKMFLLFRFGNHNRTMLWHIECITPRFCIPICTAAFLYRQYIKSVNTSDWLVWKLGYTPCDYLPIMKDNVIQSWTLLETIKDCAHTESWHSSSLGQSWNIVSVNDLVALALGCWSTAFVGTWFQ